MIAIQVPLSFDQKLLDKYPEIKGVQVTFPSPCRNVVSVLSKIKDLIEYHHNAGYFVSIHSPFWINVCNHLRQNLFKNSVRMLSDLGNLGADYLVTHVGCYYPKDEFLKAEIPQDLLIESLKKLSGSYQGETKLLLENTSGNSLNSDPGMLENLLKVPLSGIGICVDTCHLFTGEGHLLKDLDGSFDMVHLNPIPEKHKAFSHRDRHGAYSLLDCVQLDRGAYLRLVDRFSDIPVVLENNDVDISFKSIRFLRGEEG